MSFKFPLALAAALLGSTASAAPNLVTNGSFEAPNIVGGSYVLYPTASTAVTGWTVLGPTAGESVQLKPDTYLGVQASDGRVLASNRARAFATASTGAPGCRPKAAGRTRIQAVGVGPAREGTHRQAALGAIEAQRWA